MGDKSQKQTVESARDTLTEYDCVSSVLRCMGNPDFRVVFEAQPKRASIRFEDYQIVAVRPEGGVCWVNYNP